jgi:hypothetical protein
MACRKLCVLIIGKQPSRQLEFEVLCGRNSLEKRGLARLTHYTSRG